jgi:hypothetical protein
MDIYRFRWTDEHSIAVEFDSSLTPDVLRKKIWQALNSARNQSRGHYNCYPGLRLHLLDRGCWHLMRQPGELDNGIIAPSIFRNNTDSDMEICLDIAWRIPQIVANILAHADAIIALCTSVNQEIKKYAGGHNTQRRHKYGKHRQ